MPMQTPFPQGMPIRQAPGMDQMPLPPIQQGMAGDIGQVAGAVAGEVDAYAGREAKLQQMIQKRQDAMKVQEALNDWKQKEYELDQDRNVRAESQETRVQGDFDRAGDKRKLDKENLAGFYTKISGLDPSQPGYQGQFEDALAEFQQISPEDLYDKKFPGASGGSKAKGERVNSGGKLWFLDKVNGTVTPINNPDTGVQLKADPRYKIVDTVTGQLIFDPRTKATTDLGTESPGAYTAKLAKNREYFKHMKFKQKNDADIQGINDFMELATSVANDPSLKDISGILGPAKSKVWGTKAFDLQQKVDRLIAMGAIETMSQLKANSPTGSTGFGALNKEELATLRSAFSSLSATGLSTESKKKELLRMVVTIKRWRARIEKYEGDMERIFNEGGDVAEETIRTSTPPPVSPPTKGRSGLIPRK